MSLTLEIVALQAFCLLMAGLILYLNRRMLSKSSSFTLFF